MDENISTLWSEVLTLLENEVTPIGYNTWIKTIIPKSISGDTLTLSVTSSINKNMIDHRYSDLIKNAVIEICGASYNISVVVGEEGQQITKNSEPQKIYGMPLNPKYTFDTFVVGNSNRFAHAASLAVAESPAMAYNPLFLYGGVGLGKTHLLHAIGNYIKENNPASQIAYISSETFTNELINSIRDKKTEQFRNKYRSVDVLMVDDIQFIAGKVQTEEEFFHTFNTLYDANKQIIITSDKHPEEIKTLEERLRSRFEWGLIGDINSPDYETRVAILQKKAQIEGIEISDDILKYIAEKITSNIRELEGVFNKVLAYRGLVNKEITMEVATEALKYYEQHSGAKIITPEMIIESCAKYYNIRKEDIMGTRKTKEIALPRQVSMYLLREILGLSQLKIAKFFGKDHTTVMYAINKVEKEISEDSNFHIEIDNLREDIKN